MDRRDTLLIACGAAEDRGILRSVFENSYHILEADKISRTMVLLDQNHSCIAAVMTDIAISEQLDRRPLLVPGGQIPFVVVTDDDSPERAAMAFRSGAADVIPIAYDPYAMQQRIRNIVDLFLHRCHLEELVREQAAPRGTDTPSGQAYEELREKMERYEIILARTENILFEWDLMSDTISFSDAWEGIFGFPPVTHEARKGLADGGFFHPEDIPLLLRRIQALEDGASCQMAELRIAKRNGGYLWCRFRATALRDAEGILRKIGGIIINIDEEKRTGQALQDRAERDALTDMLNKQTAQSRAREYLRQCAQGVGCAMLVIDLDNFKYINDRYGHMFGDAVLSQAAQEIKKQFRAQDIVGRIGGDEFMVLLRGTRNRQLVAERCARLAAILRELFRKQPNACPLSCSIGVAISPDDGMTYEDLFRHADQALYQAKNQGKDGYVFYDGSDPAFQTWRKMDTAIGVPEYPVDAAVSHSE